MLPHRFEVCDGLINEESLDIVILLPCSRLAVKQFKLLVYHLHILSAGEKFIVGSDCVAGEMSLQYKVPMSSNSACH